MSFTTDNAQEMQRKRGRPSKADSQAQEAHTQPEPAPEHPKERLIPLVLKRGWWPYDGTMYMDPSGRQQVYKTPVMPDGSVDEMARKRTKFEAGTRIEVPASMAHRLVEAGKATLDVTV